MSVEAKCSGRVFLLEVSADHGVPDENGGLG